MIKLKKENLIQALSLLTKNAKIIAPSSDGDTVAFVPWDGRTVPCLEGSSKLPPKDVLFPKTEKMYRYDTKSASIEELASCESLVVFGIRPCDAASIANMDKVFLEDGYTDSYYRQRRDALTLIAVGCTSPARTCFCDSMGGSPNEAPFADIMMNDAGGAFTVSAKTPKGKEVLKTWKKLLSDELGEAKKAECSLKTAWNDEMPEKLAGMFEDPMWADLSRGCLGCGTCTYVCPTCYCFDIGQETHGGEGTAFRCWDSCMFSDYTRMAGGHNPRPTKKERLRNRYLHKLSYFNNRHGRTLCVGCGRCIESCPANLDISEFIDKAGGVCK